MDTINFKNYQPADSLLLYEKVVSLYAYNNKVQNYSLNEQYFSDLLFWFDSAGFNDQKKIGRIHLLRGINFRRIGDFSNALPSILTAIELYEKAFEENHYKIFSAYINLGENYLSLGENKKAFDTFRVSRDMQTKTEKSDKWERTHRNMAMALMGLGSEELAGHYMDVSLTYQEKYNRWNDNMLIDFAGELSQATRYDQSEYYLDNFAYVPYLNSNNKRRYYNIKSQNAIHSFNLDSADVYLKKEKTILDSYPIESNDKNKFLAWNTNNRGVYHFYKGEFSKSIDLFEKSYQLNSSRQDTLKYFINLSIAYLKQNKTGLSTEYLNQASKYLGSGEKSRSWDILYYSQKIDLFLNKYESTKNPEWLDQANQSFILLENYVDNIKNSISSDNNIEEFAALSKDLYSYGIKIYLKFYNDLQKETYFDNINTLVQKSKAIRLLLEIERKKQLTSAQLSDHLFVQKNIDNWSSRVRSNDSLSTRVIASDSLDYYLNLSYSGNQHVLKYGDINFEPALTIGQNEMILNYYLNIEDSVLLILVQNSESRQLIDKKTHPSFFTAIQKLLHKKKINPSSLDTLNRYLLSGIELNRPVIRIIPDHVIALVPFDALKYQGHYLLEEFSIFFDFHSLIRKRQQQTNIRTIYLAAPEFQKSKYIYLPYNQQEKQVILGLFKDVDVGENWEKSDLVHFASHAFVDDANSNENTIILSPLENHSNIKVKDLKFHNIDSKLITLSACETGLGEIIDGEGINSLSRGFYIAGAQSIVHSLWQVNDKSTYLIMRLFYDNLINGMSKHAALKWAKLAYYENADPEYKDPYYWSGFVIYGDQNAVSINEKWGVLKIGILSIFLIISILFYFFMRSRFFLN